MKSIAKYIFFVSFIAIASFQLYWSSYSKNEFSFWEESRNIDLVQKFDEGIFTLSEQAPLPIIVISWGKYILKKDKSIETYRVLPTLLGIISIFIFVAIIFELSNSFLIAAVLSLFPLLDTGLQLQLRAAMADSFSVFGALMCLFAFIKLLRLKTISTLKLSLYSLLWSLGFSIALLSKLNSIYLIILWPILYFYKSQYRKKITLQFFVQFLIVAILSLSVWTYYVSTQKKMGSDFSSLLSRPLSSAQENRLLKNENTNFSDLVKQVYDQISFYVYSYAGAGFEREAAVMGSDALFWPLGSRPILYRWERVDFNHRYLMFIPNVWTWGLAFLSILGAFVMWIKKGKLFIVQESEMTSLLLVYVFSLLFLNLWGRVFYLYEYIPFLIIAWMIFARLLGQLSLNMKHIYKVQLLLCFLPFLVFGGYYQNRAFVAFYTQNCQDLKHRYFPPFWGMKFQSCKDEEDQSKYNKSLENK